MCINKRWIRNPYNGRTVFVKCGKCPACQQEKANARAIRIKNNHREGYLPYLCTFTYANDFIPYIRRSELQAGGIVNIYRDKYIRKVRVSSDYDTQFKIYDVIKPIDRFELSDDYCLKYLPSLNGQYDNDKIGVCYYKDIQDFFKRFKQNLKRNYDFQQPITSFQCSEYGSKTLRPHFHLLIWCPTEKLSTFRSAIDASWPFDVGRVKVRKIEVARNAENYVSSYLNKSKSFPDLFKDKKLRQKHSYSHGFGVGFTEFSLSSILSHLDSGDFKYNCYTVRDNVPVVLSVPIPKYAISRYFPKIKGLCKLASSTIFELLSNFEVFATRHVPSEMDLTVDDCKKIYTKLKNKINQVISLGDKRITSAFDYARYYVKAIVGRGLWLLKEFYDSEDFLRLPVYEKYDNLSDVIYNKVHSNVVLPNNQLNYCLNPNYTPLNVSQHNKLLEKFGEYEYRKNVSNCIMSEMGYDV